MTKRIVVLIIIALAVFVGCKQASSPVVPEPIPTPDPEPEVTPEPAPTPEQEVTPVPEVEVEVEKLNVINLVGVTSDTIQAAKGYAGLGQIVLKGDLSSDLVSVSFDSSDVQDKINAIKNSVVFAFNSKLAASGVNAISAANVGVVFNDKTVQAMLTANSGAEIEEELETADAIVTITGLSAIEGYEFDGNAPTLEILLTEKSIVIESIKAESVKPEENANFYAEGAWKLENNELVDASIKVKAGTTATYGEIASAISIKLESSIINTTVKSVSFSDSGIATDGEKKLSVVLSTEHGYIFKNETGEAAREKVIELTVKIEQLLPELDITTFAINKIEAEAGVAGVNELSLGASTLELEVAFDATDIFDSEKRKAAVEKTIKESFTDRLDNVTVELTEIKVIEGESPNVSFTMNAPSGWTYKETKDTARKITIALKNGYNAFSGNLKPVASLAVEDIKPDLVGITGSVATGAGWKLEDSGQTPTGSVIRSVTVISEVFQSDISAKIAEKINIPYTSITSRNDNTKGTSIFTLVADDNYLFSDASKTKEIAVTYDWLEGEFKVETTGDLQSVLAAIPEDQAEGESAVIDLAATLTQEKDSTISFEVTNGKNVTFTSTTEGGAQVNGGEILTSLVVSGKGTAVTIKQGVTITGGTSSTGGGVIVKDGAHFILDGGVITGNHSTGFDLVHGGAGVNVIKGTFTMKSGEIHGNTGVRGAAIYAGNPSDSSANHGVIVNIEGGKIYNNTAQVAGAIYVRNATVNIRNTTISGNKALYNASEIGSGGGGALVATGTNSILTINEGSVISDNFAQVYGGGISMASNGKIVISGGTVKDNYRGLEAKVENIDNVTRSQWSTGQHEIAFSEGISLTTNILQDGLSNKIVDGTLTVDVVSWPTSLETK